MKLVVAVLLFGVVSLADAAEITITVPDQKLVEVDAVRGSLTRLQWARKALREALVRDAAELARVQAETEIATIEATCEADVEAEIAEIGAAKLAAETGW